MQRPTFRALPQQSSGRRRIGRSRYASETGFHGSACYPEALVLLKLAHFPRFLFRQPADSFELFYAPLTQRVPSMTSLGT